MTPVAPPATPAAAAKRAHYRTLILDAAERVFAASGFAQAKMSHIAREAGVSLTTMYATFSGKQPLFAALHERRGAQLMARTIETMDLSADPLSLLLDGVRAYVAFHLEHPDYLRMHLREGGAWGVSPFTPSAEQTTMLVRGMQAATAVFARGVQLGVFVADDPAVMARTMIATHQVRLADWVDRGCPSGETDRLIHAMQAQLVRTFCADGPTRAAWLMAQEKTSWP